MTPAIYHKIVAKSVRFHDYPYRVTAGAGCREIVRSTGTLFGRNSQS